MTPRLVASIVGFAMIVCWGAAARADVLPVPDEYGTLREAIDAARDGDVVLVADGVYTGPDNRDLDFAGKLITVRSERGPAQCVIDCEGAGRAFRFASGETGAAIVEGLTIRRGRVSEGQGGAILCAGSAPTIRDCVFVENEASGTAQFAGWGGAIHCDAASPVIDACRFTGNVVRGSGPDTAGGGAIGCLDGASPAISGCVFTGNRADGAAGGGGMASGTGGAIGAKQGCAPTITDCEFTNNAAVGPPMTPFTAVGGALILSIDCDATIARCTFTRNAAIGSGPETAIAGAVFVFISDPVLEDCTFTDNRSGVAGGAMWIQQSVATLRRCRFEGNTAESGGAIANFLQGNPTIEECVFTGNTVSSDNELQRLIGGGAIGSVLGSFPLIARCEFTGNAALDGSGGAVSTSSNSTSTIVSCVFLDNYALTGGAINTGILPTPLDGGGTSHLVNCLFACNGAEDRGGAVFNERSTLTMANCTVVGNTAGVSGGGVTNVAFGSDARLDNCIVHDNAAPEAPQISDDPFFWPVAARYCLVQGGWTGDGNIDATPDFVDAAGPDGDPATCDDNDYRLAPGSPGVDAGDNFALPPDHADLDGDGDRAEPTPLDLADLARRADDQCAPDTGLGAPPVVDMGAYESPPVIDACDCNDNGVLDSEDIASGTSEDANGNGIPDECESPFVGMAVWINPDGGIFRFASNWDPGTPDGSNEARFGLDATYTVAFDQDALSRRLAVARGDVTFDITPGGGAYEYHLGATDEIGIVVGEAMTDDATLTVRGGTVSAAGNVTIGRDAGTRGTLQVIGAGAALTTAESLCVGCFGAGAMIIDGGGTVVSRDAVIGDQPESDGSVVVRGEGSLWSVPFFITIIEGSLHVGAGATVSAGVDPFSGIFLLGDGAISGDGLIDASVVNFGEIVPTVGAGPLTIASGYYQSGQIPELGPASGAMRVSVGGPAPGLDHGQLAVLGEAVLAGGLFVDLTNGYEPALGERFAIVQSALVDGQFDVALLPGLAANRFLRVRYVPAGGPGGPDEVALVVEDLGELFGGFGPPQSIGLPGAPTGVVLDDFDGDGFPDLAIAVPDADPSGAGRVIVLLNAGTDADGTWLGFGDTIEVTVGRGPSDITAGFLDGDAALDLAVPNALDGSVTVLVNDLAGGGTFVASTVADVGPEPSAIAAGDFAPGPGRDLAVALASADAVRILENDGAAGFVPSAVIPAGVRPVSIDPEDLDDDKDTDLVVANEGSGSVTVIHFDMGEPPLLVELPVGAGPVDVTTEDLDRNGFADIVTANRADGTVSVVLNDGAATYRPSVDFPVGDEPRSVTGIDLEGDGDVDLALVAADAQGDPVVRILRNDLNDGTQLAFAAAETLTEADDPVFVVSGDLDLDATDDLVAVGEGASPGGAAGGGTPAGPGEGAVTAFLNLTNRTCPTDVDGNGVTGFGDLELVLVAWGSCASCREDIDASGEVDFQDLLLVLYAWGPCE